jgi:2-polyprenyl-3-methyl-5-hydroxy-6-metoxy-1,4-benzoquinol methylase
MGWAVFSGFACDGNALQCFADPLGSLMRWLSLLNNHVRPGVRILDMGCGAGIPLTLALSNTFDVTGVDISAR